MYKHTCSNCGIEVVTEKVDDWHIVCLCQAEYATEDLEEDEEE